jgi:hypothetical protein
MFKAIYFDFTHHLNFLTCTRNTSEMGSISIFKSRVWFLMRSLDFFNWPNPVLGTTQPLTEMSTRNLPGVACWRVRLATSLPSVNRLSEKMWEPRRLTTLWASTACYGIALLFLGAATLTLVCCVRAAVPRRMDRVGLPWRILTFGM